MPKTWTHLLGLGRPASGKPSAEEEEDDDKKRDAHAEDGEGDDEDEKKAGEGDEEGDGEGEPKKGKRATDDEDDDAEMSEDEDDEKDKGDAKATAARKRERARCAAIFASKHAATRPDMAAHLAFESNLGRRAACAMLRQAAKGSAPRGLAQRMSGMEQLRPGAGSPGGKPNIQSSWDAAAQRAGVRLK